jgi:hypothetical protein
MPLAVLQPRMRAMCVRVPISSLQCYYDIGLWFFWATHAFSNIDRISCLAECDALELRRRSLIANSGHRAKV